MEVAGLASEMYGLVLLVGVGSAHPRYKHYAFDLRFREGGEEECRTYECMISFAPYILEEKLCFGLPALWIKRGILETV